MEQDKEGMPVSVYGEVLDRDIESLGELRRLPEGSVVKVATEGSEWPIRYKDGGVWRIAGRDGTFNFTTHYAAMTGELKLIYLPPASA
ncbi:hypothetical protein [Micromonospora sp. CB01531]|uniref:hypothetical protein n=1 Tax=Micromonospora sp. CB01531 TaxID=1718947 RepID=UPI00093AE4B4|nr:hypothetical protein [Micromonospora sp. CB01531]OKI45089.1 hypothetical protein A6A27_11765 [Micromonospora sp. CB01531]